MYSSTFFEKRQALTQASANIILEHVFNVLRPKSILDLGCATGVWLAEAKRRGAPKVLGIDGPWVPQELLKIEKEEFLSFDFTSINPQEVGRFDVAFCIEVAEHLAPNAANRLVSFLTSHTDAVLFSAAVPGQGGTGHINEQVQSYWHQKFCEMGFTCFDLIRPVIWGNPSVNIIYQQNMLLYAKIDSEMMAQLRSHPSQPPHICSPYQLDRVHPELLKTRADARTQGGLKKRVNRFLEKIRSSSSKKSKL